MHYRKKSIGALHKTFTRDQIRLRRKILKITHEVNLSHIGSCLTMVDIIYAIYNIKEKKDTFVLSNGHAAVALYAVLEEKGLLQNPSLKVLNVHPDRNLNNYIEVSTGSLGQGLLIAVGMALANKRRRIFCSVSDGECAEGSIWEAIRISSELKLSNLYVIINANGWGAYGRVSLKELLYRLQGFTKNIVVVDGHDLTKLEDALTRKSINKPVIIVAKTIVNQFTFLKDLDSHYYVMSEENFREAMEILRDK